MRALTKTLRDGRTATVTIEAATAWTGAVTRSWIDGKEIGNHVGPHHLRANMPPGHVAAVGPLVLTQAEADQVEAAYYAFVAGLPRDLDAERRLLVAARNAAVVAAELDKEAAINAYTGGGDPWPGRQAAEKRIFERSVALGEFDHAYPKTAAKAATAQAAATERAMWS